MSDQDSTKLPPAPYDEPDWLLGSLVRMTDGSKLEIPVTLTVGGSLITGKIVDGKAYFDHFAQQFTSGLGFDAEPAKALQDSFAAHGDVYTKRADSDESMPPSYIHLKDAKFVSVDGHMMPSQGEPFLWRGRLVDVSGFTLGTLTKAES